MDGNIGLESFLTAHVIGKDSTNELTHTELGKIVKRKFHIPPEDYDAFMKAYYRDVIKAKRTHHIIERQMIHKQQQPGPLLIDLDFQFLGDCVTRQYTTTHIRQLMDHVLNVLADVFEMDEDVNFLMVAAEKPNPRVVTKTNGSSIVKDGIHIMFCVRMDGLYHQYIRKRLLELLPPQWEGVPIINDWTDVLDTSISNGTNGWLAPLSQKPDDVQPYNVTLAYNVSYDTDRLQWNKIPLVESPTQLEAFYAQQYKQLFIRNPNLPMLSLEKDSACEKIELFRQEIAKPTTTSTTVNGNNTVPSSLPGGDEYYQISVNTVRQVHNREDMNTLLNVFLDNLPPHKYELREAYEFAMTLPSNYYGAGSYEKWIKVGFALRNTSIYLLIAWLAFSAQSPSFDFSKDVMSLCDFWMKFIHQPQGGVTRLSLMYWSKHDAPEEYQKVHESTVDFFLDQTIANLSLDQLSAKGKSKGGSCDYDIATVVHQLKKGSFVASGIRNNAWYCFNGSFWSKDDSGTTLRNLLSTEVRGLYLMKSKRVLEKAHQIKTKDGDVDIESEEHILMKARANLLIGIATRLGTTHDKDNIMRECRELFYDREFEQKLDQNRYLMCFKNGVVDFKEKRFRKGFPEDYLSKCTQTDFHSLDESRDKVLMEQIHEYMRQLFPIPELCKYMWDHLASVLIGDTAKTQCLHYYTGVGQNGKSMLIKLLQTILGDYATELDVSFFVNERPSRGKATPELLCLVGSRLAVTAEPSEGEKLNEGPMKQLTSGTDKITFRGLFKDQESFIPQVHSVIMANHYLPVKSRDHGTWRRIRVVKFLSLFVDNPVEGDEDKPYQFKKADDFDDKFKKWAPVIMAMLVELAYQNQGSLPMCDIVAEYSNQYRKEQDFIAEYMQERLTPCAPEERLLKSNVIRDFDQWYQETYSTKITGKTTELVKAIEKIYGTYKSCWRGVKIKRETQHINNNDTDSEVSTVTSAMSK